MRPSGIQMSISAVALGLSLATTQVSAQFAVPRNLSAPRVKQIWSRNKKFVADVYSDQKVIRIGKVDWQGNIGRTTPLWFMEGTFTSGWLADDGAHLVAGLESPSSVPQDYTRDQILLSFFRRDQLIRHTRLDELITDLSKLQKDGATYRWAKYVELNVCGYLAVETIEGKKFLFDVTTGEITEFSAEKAYRVTGWDSYQDSSRCYQFQFPSAYSLKENLTSRGNPAGWLLLKRAEDKEWLIEASVEDMADYPREFAGMNFEEFVFDRARAMYSADGPGSSTYATDVVRQRRFVNRNHLDAIEFFLVVAHETSDEDGKTTIEKETIGPVYAVSIGAPEAAARVLFLRPVNGREKEFAQVNPPLLTIVDTVWRFSGVQ
jgi:hypothetical protein